ncbi:Ig-like domain-containing protein [Isoalcanivorax indicus]|uniref:Ig-like domain-containing protein n=1 Tax=Isoalcanivorax indicus TaxID=2202653 RepID=UPI000DB9B480|nr:Ig-like domain-containing protein [Isoalcanivorax indicus]
MKKHLIISAVALGLVACGGDEATVTPGTERDAARQGLVYAYPAHEQLEVPTPAPIVLRFSSAVVDSNPEMFITVRDANGDEVPYSIETGIGDGQGLVLTPDERLAPRSEYTVEIDGITLERGAAQPRTLTFTTKGLTEGPRELVASGAGDFDLLRKIPDGNTLPIMDFSSFRLQFNQPLDRTTVSYGSSVALEGPDGVVDAHLIVHGPYMTVDPKEDLTPGVEYTLSLSNAIQSVYTVIDEDDPSDSVDVFPGYSVSFTPLDSGSRSFLTQEVSEGTSVSMLTGKPVNMVPLEAVLLGDDNQTQQSGFLQAELAHIPTHPDFAPLRIKRGSMLSGTDMDVLIGGVVPAGFNSGAVNIHFISDAVGYLERNPYSEAEGARRQLRLFMDVAITTEDPRANGAVTQDLLHLELIGTAEIRDGRLTADAVSVAEPRVLGSENARSVLSFFMQSTVGGDGGQQPILGNPVLQSWSLGTDTFTGDNKALQAKPGDPLIFNFDQALDPESVAGNVRLFHNDDPMDIEYFVDGGALVVKLSAIREVGDDGITITRPGFQLSPADAPNIYRVEVDGATNLAGDMAVDLPLVEEFELATIVPDYDLLSPEIAPEFTTSDLWVARRTTSHSPVILAAYPGFPCALQEEFIAAGGFTGLFDGTTDIGLTYRDLANDVAGVCAGGAPAITDGTERENRESDDPVPVMNMPANRPIIVAFGKEIDATSVVLGETFLVEKISEDEQSLEYIAGEVEISDMTLIFRPDQPWEQGELYRYTVKSSGWALCRRQSGSVVEHRQVANDATEIRPCGSDSWNLMPGTDQRAFECGIDAVCDNEGLPLRTLPMGISTVSKIANPGPNAIRHYNMFARGSSPTAGGPNMVHFFRGAEPSQNVLQILRTQPVADTNRNFISERSNLGAADTDTLITLRDFMLGFGDPNAMDIISAGTFSFDIEEYGPEGALVAGDLGFGLYPDYDPNGVKPAKNSVKVLSRFDAQGDVGALSGANVGCSYDSEFDPNTFQGTVGEPLECPDNKFSYLMSAAIAEVTDEVTEQGVKVKLWPSVVMGTALDLYINTDFIGFFDYAAGAITGPQILRMRYSGNGGDEPITGWISEQSQHAVMSMDMELYFDAPYAGEWSPIENPLNLSSYPILMSLEGDVSFLDDGRMEVEQYNKNRVDIDVELWDSSGKSGYIDLFIPEYGSRINMISEPIK